MEEKAISKREGHLMKASIEDIALQGATGVKNQIRADILKNMLLVLMR